MAFKAGIVSLLRFSDGTRDAGIAAVKGPVAEG